MQWMPADFPSIPPSRIKPPKADRDPQPNGAGRQATNTQNPAQWGIQRGAGCGCPVPSGPSELTTSLTVDAKEAPA